MAGDAAHFLGGLVVGLPLLQFEMCLSPQYMVNSGLEIVGLAQHAKHPSDPRMLCAHIVPIAT